MSKPTFKMTVDWPTRTAVVEELVYVADGLGEDLGRTIEKGSQYESERIFRRLKMIVKMLDRLDGWGSNHNHPAVGPSTLARDEAPKQYDVMVGDEFFSWLSDRLASMEDLHFDDLTGVHGNVEAEAYDNYKLLVQLQARLRADMTERLCLPAVT